MLYQSIIQISRETLYVAVMWSATCLTVRMFQGISLRMLPLPGIAKPTSIHIPIYPRGEDEARVLYTQAGVERGEVALSVGTGGGPTGPSVQPQLPFDHEGTHGTISHGAVVVWRNGCGSMRVSPQMGQATMNCLNSSAETRNSRWHARHETIA